MAVPVDVTLKETRAPSRIEQFEIQGELGRGGMAVVYAATDADSGKKVALKLIDKNADETLKQRFEREAKAAAQLAHPGICKVIAFGETERGLFMAMEYVEGDTLHALSKKAPVVPAAIAADVLRQLLEALAHAHAAGVIHRDIKPQNVMLTPAGAVKLLDFGIAKSAGDETLTQTGMLVGTPAFMSPEQARADVVDGRSDLFSAGATVTALIRKSSHRFTGTKLDPTQMMMRVAYEPLGPLFEVAPHVPVALDVVLAHLMALSPDARAKSAESALTALHASGLVPKDGPAVLAAFLRSPVDVASDLAREQAKRELVHADQAGKRTGGEIACALSLHRALTLNPSDHATAARLLAHCERHELTFDDVKDAKIDDLLVAFKEAPAQPGVLKALADRYRALGHARLAAAFLWRYVVARPDDSLAARQLTVMLDGPGDTSTDTGRKLSTRDIVAGIKTGGLKNAPVAPAGVPTRSLARPVASTGSVAVAPVVVAARDPDLSAWGKWAAVSVLVLALGGGVYMLASGLSLAKRAVDKAAPLDPQSADPAVAAGAEGGIARGMIARQTAGMVRAAEQALAAGDASLAVSLAGDVLKAHPSIEAGRAALWVRARAYAADNQPAEALKDCEEYLEKATDFDDPHIGEVKRLMATLRPPAG